VRPPLGNHWSPWTSKLLRFVCLYGVCFSSTVSSRDLAKVWQTPVHTDVEVTDGKAAVVDEADRTEAVRVCSTGDYSITRLRREFLTTDSSQSQQENCEHVQTSVASTATPFRCVCIGPLIEGPQPWRL